MWGDVANRLPRGTNYDGLAQVPTNFGNPMFINNFHSISDLCRSREDVYYSQQ